MGPIKPVKDKLCVTNVIETFHKIIECINKGNKADVVYLNIQNEFDNEVRHRLVISIGRQGV